MIGNIQVYNMRGNYGTYGVYGWNPITAAVNWWTGGSEDEPPTYEQATAADPNVIVANTKVRDGKYSWIVYSNGELKIFDVPAGKESLIGTRYRIGNKNYASTLAVLRKRSKEVDKVLAKGGLSGAKLAAGATFAEASQKPSSGGSKPSKPSSGGSGSSPVYAPAVQDRKTPPWGAIGGIGAGVVGLIILFAVLARRKKGKKS